MAAKRNGIRTVILPKENQRDLTEIDPVVRQSLRFVAAESIDSVLGEALYKLEPKAEQEEEMIAAFLPTEAVVKDSSLRQ